jgi:hypothetical protein
MNSKASISAKSVSGDGLTGRNLSLCRCAFMCSESVPIREMISSTASDRFGHSSTIRSEAFLQNDRPCTPNRRGPIVKLLECNGLLNKTGEAGRTAPPPFEQSYSLIETWEFGDRRNDSFRQCVYRSAKRGSLIAAPSGDCCFAGSSTSSATPIAPKTTMSPGLSLLCIPCAAACADWIVIVNA